MTKAVKKTARRGCAGGCSRLLPEPIAQIAFCSTCWNVNKVLLAEGAIDLRELAAQWRSRDQLLARLDDILRRSDVNDADLLMRELERRLP